MTKKDPVSKIMPLKSSSSFGDPSGSFRPAPPPMPSRAPMEPSTSLGKTDTKLVNRSKCMVYLVLFLSAAICGVSTYFFMEEEDRRWYTHEFEERAEEVLQGVQNSLGHSFTASGNLAGSWTLQTTNQERNHGTHGANVTYSNFAVLGMHLSNAGMAQMMAVLPVVPAANRSQWETYAVQHQSWIQEDVFLISSGALTGDFQVVEEPPNPGRISERMITSGLPPAGSTGDSFELHMPIWQIYPTPRNATNSPIMLDLLAYDWFSRLWKEASRTHMPTISTIRDLDFLVEYADLEGEQEVSSPKFVIVEHIFGGYKETDVAVAAGITVVSWMDYFKEVLQDQPAGIIVDIQNSCPTDAGKTYTFKRTTNSIVYLGEAIDFGPLNIALSTKHHILFGEMSSMPLDLPQEDDECGYLLTVHATDEFTKQWQRNISSLAAGVIFGLFGFTAFVFFFYTFYVKKRNLKLTNTAARSTAIVSSLFPKNVAEQMMREVEHHQGPSATSNVGATIQEAVRLLTGPSHTAAESKKAPIADLFADTTIMFADIAGFTAWSNKRKPQDVFTLLETIFNAFDGIADRRGVFKVETVGDCYVAVCGLPEPTRDHAVVMARFSWDCMRAMREIKNTLEKKLGPDTNDLDMRFGLHSGPVTAGVIRGTRPRFQLFGDSMNKTSRIESHGQKGRLHISEEMANILIQNGKEHWVSKREDAVDLKGLGKIPTYWLGLENERHWSRTGSVTSATCTASSEVLSSDQEFALIKNQIIDWKNPSDVILRHVNVLAKYLVRILQARQEKQEIDEVSLKRAETSAIFGEASPSAWINFDKSSVPITVELESNTLLQSDVVEQLKDFVQQIFDAYNPHALFHNIQHASHVVLSLNTLLESTKGSQLDPLTEFALVLSAFVHDVDHPGVINEQLVTEKDALAVIYRSSTTERNSLDVFWKIFSQKGFYKLRRTIYWTNRQFEHFRQVMVQAILATDMANIRLQQDRMERWGDSLRNGRVDLMSNKDKTCLVEQLIQVAVISHATETWELYKKWNRKLYAEMSAAFQNGQGQNEPSEFWYKKGLDFFDFTVIPLATVVMQQEAFRRSGQTMLINAAQNRDEWKKNGKLIVAKSLRISS